MQKMVPFVTRETTFGQHVSELVFGVNIPDLDFGIKIDSVKQPTKSNSEGSWHMSHSRSPSFDYHLDNRLIIFEDV